MIWYRSIGQLEIIFICLFGIFYLAYIVRILYIAHKLKAVMSSLYLKLVLRASYFSLMIVALLGPSFGDFKKEVKSVSRNIWFIIDVSPSMKCKDLQPSRLEKLKFETENLINSLPGERIGIVLYSQNAFMHCPLTYDQESLFLFLRSINADILQQKGSNPSAAINLILEHNKNNKDESNQKGILVLASDGEDFEETLEQTVINLPKGYNLHVLGVGTKTGDRIPEGKGFLRDQAGKYVTTTLHKDKLIHIASIGKGRSFWINEEENDIPLLSETIRQSEGTYVETQKIDTTANKYLYFLLTAFLLIITDTVVTVNTLK